MNSTVSLVLIILTIVLLIVSFVCRLNKQRNLSKTFEVLTCWSLFAYSCRYIDLFEHLSSMHVEQIILMLFFIFCLFTAVIKTILLFKYK